MNNALLPPTIIGHTSTCQNGQEEDYFERPKKEEIHLMQIGIEWRR